MTIRIDSATDLVTMTRAEYEALLEAVEDAEDMARLAALEERERLLGVEKARADYLPGELVDRVIEGESPLRIWREHRGMSLSELARKAGLAASYLSEIEKGRKPGSLAAVKKLATALDLQIEDIV